MYTVISYFKMAEITNLFLVLSIIAACEAQFPEVDTVYGRVRGQSIPLSSGNVIDSYLGIPFARAPVGDLRFEVLFIKIALPS